MKKFSLKSMLFPLNNPTSPHHSTMDWNLTQNPPMVQIPGCPEAPYLLTTLQSLAKLVLSRQAFKAFPGSFLKQWLLNWYQKVIDDYNEISNTLVARINHFADAYYNWMEDFMEMDHDSYLSSVEIPIVESNGNQIKSIDNSFQVNTATGLRHTLADTFNAMAAGLEKVLIVFSRVINSGMEFQNPKLEIVNPEVVNKDITTKKETLANVRPERKFIEELQKLKNYIPGIFLNNGEHFALMNLLALKWLNIASGEVLSPMLTGENKLYELQAKTGPLKYPH